MSAGARTYFCENGHIVISFSDDVLAIEIDGKYIYSGDEIPCPICNSTNIKCCFEWGNSDYKSGKMVPVEPKEIKGTGKYIEIMEHVYDVSKLFKEK